MLQGCLRCVSSIAIFYLALWNKIKEQFLVSTDDSGHSELFSVEQVLFLIDKPSSQDLLHNDHEPELLQAKIFRRRC